MTSQTTALLYLRAACSNAAAIADQRRRCVAYAEARGWRIPDVVVNSGVGAIADTPKLKVVRDLIAGDEAQAVIATDLDRISRDHVQVIAFARFCRQHDAELCLAQQTVNVDVMLDVADRVEGADLGELYAARKARP